jgi:hypothetical protein
MHRDLADTDDGGGNAEKAIASRVTASPDVAAIRFPNRNPAAKIYRNGMKVTITIMSTMIW